MDSPFYGSLFVCAVMVVSVLGLVIVRRFVDIESLKKHHDVASFFFLMIGTLYAVLIAFAIFVVWTQFQDAGTNLEREVNEVGDLSRMSVAMPDPLRANIRTALTEYIHAVLEDEFPAMADGRESQRTWAAIQNVWNVYEAGDPNNPKFQAFYAESIRHLNELSNDRRIRLFTSRGTVPQTLWYLLYAGGVVLVLFTYFFGHESLGWQAAMTAALSGTLAFSLFLIAAYNGPYDGSTRIAPTPYQMELQHVETR